MLRLSNHDGDDLGVKRALILSIRADIDGSCAKQCAVFGKDLSRGIDYAVAHGARIIGVPLVGPHSLPTVEAALTRAVAALGVPIASVEREFVVHDSDLGIDDGWIGQIRDEKEEVARR